MPIHLPLFVLTTALLAMLPAAGQALVVRQVLTGGRRAAWSTVAGTATGLLIWSAAAAAGLSAVLLANPSAYAAVRIGGGVLLVLLGVTTLWSSRRRGVAGPGVAPAGLWRGYLAGLGTNLGNPKAGVFAISLLPQFVTADGPVLISSLALGVIWALVTASWYVLFTWAVDRGRRLMSRPSVQRGLQLTTGAVLVALGLAVGIR